MKTFDIKIAGKTLVDILLGIEEARKKIEAGEGVGGNCQDDGDYSFMSEGEYEEKTKVGLLKDFKVWNLYGTNGEKVKGGFKTKEEAEEYANNNNIYIIDRIADED